MSNNAVEIVLSARDAASAALSGLKTQLTGFSTSSQKAGADTSKAMDAAGVAIDEAGRRASVVAKLMEKGFSEAAANGMAKGWENLGKAAEDAGKKAEDAGKKTEDGGKKAETSFKNASLAARGLGQEIGINLPRSVSAFLAQSQTIGPILSGAFSVIAVVGFIEALSQVPKVYDQIIGKISGFGAAEQKTYAALLTWNKKVVDDLNQHKLTMATIIGQGPAEQKRQIDELIGKMANLQTTANADRVKAEGMLTSAGPNGEVVASGSEYSDLIAEAKKYEAQANEINDDIRTRRQRLDEDNLRIQTENDKKAEESAKKQEDRIAHQEVLLTRMNDDEAKRLAFIDTMNDKIAKNKSAQIEKEASLREKMEDDWARLGENRIAINDRIAARNQAQVDREASLLEKMNDDWARLGENRIAINDRIAARSADAQKKTLDSVTKVVGQGFGKLWDDVFTKGQNVFTAFGDWLKSQFSALGKSLFETLGKDLARLALTGSMSSTGGGAAGGLIGMLGSIPGLSGAGSSGLLGKFGSSIGLGGLLKGGSLFSGASTAAAASGQVGSIAGIGSSAGMAGLFGLSAIATAGIGAAIVGGGFALYELFKHKTQEAPFSSDPYAAQHNRTEYFFTSMQDAVSQLSGTVADLTGKISSMSSGDVVTVGMPQAMQKTSFRRTVGGGFSNEAL